MTTFLMWGVTVHFALYYCFQTNKNSSYLANQFSRATTQLTIWLLLLSCFRLSMVLESSHSKKAWFQLMFLQKQLHQHLSSNTVKWYLLLFALQLQFLDWHLFSKFGMIQQLTLILGIWPITTLATVSSALSSTTLLLCRCLICPALIWAILEQSPPGPFLWVVVQSA